ncbi:MAG: GFA family protein [Aliihoeflea sp.]|jgi:hypothetical protein
MTIAEVRLDHHGSCACGAVSVRVKGFAVAMTECWCADCQKETGGSPTHSVIVDDEDLVMERESLGRFERVSDSGRKITRLFCRECGTSIAARPEDVPYTGLRVGVLDDRSFFRPQIVLYARNAPDWASFPEHANIFDTQPEAAAR